MIKTTLHIIIYFSDLSKPVIDNLKSQEQSVKQILIIQYRQTKVRKKWIYFL